MLHETGHALGLKHAHEVKGSFGAVPVEYDSLEYTVMSYKSYVGGPTTGYTLGSTSYPQTLMMLDIAAIQTTYGANYNTNAGNTVYSWSATTGEMFIDGDGAGRTGRQQGLHDDLGWRRSGYLRLLELHRQSLDRSPAGAVEYRLGGPARGARWRTLRRRQHRQCAALRQQSGLADRECDRRHAATTPSSEISPTIT